ncbi:hypothetical protein [Rubrivirga sp.]|uniref:hypothetical protein n=1 Tax=Rubrivirga sp. TaxID=1885344 RepID=UPI003B520710
MRPSSLALAAVLLLAPLSGCVTVSPYGDDAKTPTAEATAYAEALLARPSETLTDEELAFLTLYAQQAEARNTQARAEFEQNVFFVSTGLSVLSAVILLIDRLN